MNALDDLSDGLASRGFAVWPGFLQKSEASEIRNELLELDEKGHFKAASVGRGTTQTLTSDVRCDRTHWFEPERLTSPQRLLWSKLEGVRQHLNRTLQLGLWDLEGHYAIYPPGGFYVRHLDRFRSDDARAVSIVVYFNEDWRPELGGQLKLYVTPEGAPESVSVVQPVAGTLACFLSGSIEHEVAQSTETRLSFAGWLRRRK